MSKITIDPERCKACNTCAKLCPGYFFAISAKGQPPQPTAYEGACIECGHCVAVCPSGAIQHSAYPDGRNPINKENQVTPEQMAHLLRSRRSVRRFRDKEVAREQIEQVIDGARFTPSAHNTQGTEYVVIRDKVKSVQVAQIVIQALDAICQALASKEPPAPGAERDPLEEMRHLTPLFGRVVAAFRQGQDNVLHDAPCLMLFHGDARIPFSDINAILAVQNASLMIHSLGLGAFFPGFLVGTCQFGDSVERFLELPKHHKIFGALAFGHPKFSFKHWIDRKPARVQWL
jgi:nitroreductase/NAD-dependent dihydropyrimidine dehydrogenase PreA subunit